MRSAGWIKRCRSLISRLCSGLRGNPPLRRARETPQGKAQVGLMTPHGLARPTLQLSTFGVTWYRAHSASGPCSQGEAFPPIMGAARWAALLLPVAH
jgi:hypothetical protein